MFSKRPGDETDCMIEAAYGNFNAFRLRAGAGFTLAPNQLYARVSGSVNRRDGHVQNRDFGCLYPASGVPLRITGRLSMTAIPPSRRSSAGSPVSPRRA